MPVDLALRTAFRIVRLTDSSGLEGLGPTWLPFIGTSIPFCILCSFGIFVYFLFYFLIVVVVLEDVPDRGVASVVNALGPPV